MDAESLNCIYGLVQLSVGELERTTLAPNLSATASLIRTTFIKTEKLKYFETIFMVYC